MKVESLPAYFRESSGRWDEHARRPGGAGTTRAAALANAGMLRWVAGEVERALEADAIDELASKSGSETVPVVREGLDEAWAAAEAALPEGWFMGSLTNQSYRGDNERWMAQAYEGPELDANYRVFKAASAPTPVAALQALAARLAARLNEDARHGK